MKQIFNTFFLLLLIKTTLAQVTFQKTYGGTNSDFGSSLLQSIDGGYIIVGSQFNSSGANPNFYLNKTDSNGTLLWSKTFGGSNDERCYSIDETNDRGFILAGFTYSFGASIGGDIYLVKTDSSGNLLWSKTYGGAYGDIANCVKQTNDGGLIIAGQTNSCLSCPSDVYIIKTDSIGDTLWTRTYGGANTDKAQAIEQTNDGGYIISGTTVLSGNSEMYIIKTDNMGDTLWTKAFGVTIYNEAYSVQQTIDGGYIVAGYRDSLGAGNRDFYLLKTDTNGNLLWSKTFGGTGDDMAWYVRQTMDEGFIITGQTNSFGAGNYDVYLIKTDSIGNLLWSKTFGGIYTEYSYSVQQANDGGYIIAGMNPFAGNSNVYLIKTDSNGNSGCNESIPSTITSYPTTFVSSTTTIVSTPITTLTNPPTIVGGSAIENSLCTSVSISEIKTGNSFDVFPNPTTGNFSIAFDNFIEIGTIEILNVLGQKCFEKSIFNTIQTEINFENILPAIYFVKVNTGEKQYTKRLIVK